MKKLIALMMALAIVASFTACGGKNEPENTTETTTMPEEGISIDENIGGTLANTGDYQPQISSDSTALDLLDPIWMGLGGEHQPASYGGHFSEEYSSGPATYDLTYADELAGVLMLPTDKMDSVEDAATVVHLLNANSMTAGVVKLKEGTDVKAFADAVADRISNNQWMCGFPEWMAVVQINDNFLFIGYGLYDMINPMVVNMDSSWNAKQLYNRTLVAEVTESEEVVE